MNLVNPNYKSERTQPIRINPYLYSHQTVSFRFNLKLVFNPNHSETHSKSIRTNAIEYGQSELIRTLNPNESGQSETIRTLHPKEPSQSKSIRICIRTKQFHSDLIRTCNPKQTRLNTVNPNFKSE